MTNPLNNIKNEAAKLALTPAEKSAMKARIFGMPAPLAPAPSPYFFFNYQFLHTRVLVPLAIMLVVFVGAGTTAAAQGALPGDMLYPIKVSVNETVEVALATTPVDKAQVQASLAQRRLEEAEALAAKGTLTAATSAKLAANFEVHAANAQALAADVLAKDPDAAASLNTHIGSSLATHGAILAMLGSGSTPASKNSDSKDNGSDSLAAKVLARAGEGDRAALATPKPALPAATAPAATTDVAPQAKVRTMSAFTATTNPATSSNEDASVTPVAQLPADSEEEKAAAKLQSKAAQAFADARKQFDGYNHRLDNATAALVEAKFSEIDTIMGAGSVALDAHNYAEAKADFTQALQTSIKLSTLLIAQQKFERNIIRPVLEQLLNMNVSGSGEVRILPAWSDK